MGKVKYSFQRSKDENAEVWIVAVNRGAFKGAPRIWPTHLTLGTVRIVSTDRTQDVFDMWTLKRGYVADSLKQEAMRLLQGAEMWEQLTLARAAHFEDEQILGAITVTIGGSELTRWNTLDRALAYAYERLQMIWLRGLAVVGRAEISKPSVGTFHAIEIDAYGHVANARIERTVKNGRWQLSK